MRISPDRGLWQWRDPGWWQHRAVPGGQQHLRRWLWRVYARHPRASVHARAGVDQRPQHAWALSHLLQEV